MCSIQNIVHLSGAHNAVEFFAAVIRRAVHSTAVSFYVVHHSTLFIPSTTWNGFKVFIKALVGGTLLVIISRHEVAIVLALPLLGAGNCSWNHKHTLLLLHLANSTGNVTIGSSYNWPLVFGAIDIVVSLFSTSTLKNIKGIGRHA